jgi:hypothetical protein
MVSTSEGIASITVTHARSATRINTRITDIRSISFVGGFIYVFLNIKSNRERMPFIGTLSTNAIIKPTATGVISE